MGRQLILLLGGARSGKSSYAEKLVKTLGQRVIYVATAQAGDEEMQARIAVHRQARPPEWRTVEAPTGVGPAVSTALAAGPADAVLLDCVTMLLSNLILAGLSEADLELEHLDDAAARARVDAELDDLLAAFRASAIPWVLVSNEVGCGVVPPYALGRVYRDLLGWANQRLAAEADKAYFMVAGFPLDLKALGADLLLDGGELDKE